MADVFVERRFDLPISEDDALSMIRKFGCCMEILGVRLEEGYLATDGRRLLLRFGAPDAESVRLLFRHADMITDSVQPYRPLPRCEAGRGERI